MTTSATAPRRWFVALEVASGQGWLARRTGSTVTRRCYAPSARAGPECAIFDARKCAVFDAH